MSLSPFNENQEDYEAAEPISQEDVEAFIKEKNIFELEGHLLLPYQTDLPIDPNHEDPFARENGFFVLCREQDHKACADVLDYIYVGLMPEVFEKVWTEGYCFGYYSPTKKEFIFNSPDNKELQQLNKDIKDKQKQEKNKQDLNQSKQQQKPKGPKPEETELDKLIKKLEQAVQEQEQEPGEDQDGDSQDGQGGEGEGEPQEGDDQEGDGEGQEGEGSCGETQGLDDNENAKGGKPNPEQEAGDDMGSDEWAEEGGKGTKGSGKAKKKPKQKDICENKPSTNTKGGIQQSNAVMKQHLEADPTKEQMKLTPEELAILEAEIAEELKQQEQQEAEALAQANLPPQEPNQEGNPGENEDEDLQLTYQEVTHQGSMTKWSF